MQRVSLDPLLPLMQPLLQSHCDLNSGLRPVGAGPDLDSKKPVSTGSDLISIAGIPVVAVAGPTTMDGLSCVPAISASTQGWTSERGLAVHRREYAPFTLGSRIIRGLVKP